MESRLSQIDGGMLHIVAITEARAQDERVVVAEIYFQGAPAGIYLFDDGKHGDLEADDMVFGLTYHIPPGLSGSNTLLEVIATDGSGRSSAAFPYLAVTK